MQDAWRRWMLARHGVRVETRCAIEHAGRDAGAWAFCPDGLGERSVVYSAGVGRHIGFDLWMIRRFGLAVDAFDPTPISVEWIRNHSVSPQFRFHPVGLSDRDGEQKFYLPRSASSAHYTSVPRGGDAGEAFITAPVRRLSTLMRERGHSRLDVLKMDIEGGEYAVIEDICRSGVDIGQILVEFHHNYPGVPLTRTLAAIRQLREAGQRLFHISPRGLEFSFRRDERDGPA